MKTESAWKKYDAVALEELEAFAADYIDFISENKIEREIAQASIELAEQAGYVDLYQAFDEGRTLKPGDKVYAQTHGKAVILAQLGTDPLVKGMNILGAHIDSPRLDLKQNPLFERNELVHLDTHYYGGIKKYQWVTVPLALHGVVAKKDGTVVPINVGEDAGDPVFCVSDLLIHLAKDQMQKTGTDVVSGEDLDVLVGGRPLVISDEDAKKDDADKTELEKLAAKEPVKAYALKLLGEKYGIEEDDFLSAEIEVVPAGRARELGFDRSMILGYGHDDSSCAYPSLIAQLALAEETPKRTAVTVLVDKEEIGSVGATGMASQFFENVIAVLLELAGEGGDINLRRALASSSMLSSDVSAGFDPAYASVFEPKNAAYMGHGLVFNKYTGARGKSGSNDASAEYVARIRRIMDDADVSFQTAELGKVDAGGGGTIAYLPAKYEMDVIDSGVAVLSMHAPWEVVSKADLYEAYKGYVAFLRDAGPSARTPQN
ncbi:MAG: aminopeptidase [Eggerthellaceae bacterium]|nr:aminopeptidase [Eggerthellaceae bacterium]